MAKFTYAIYLANKEPDSSLLEKPGSKPDIIWAFDKLDWAELVETQFDTDDCNQFHIDDDETNHSIYLYLEDNRQSVQFSGTYTFPVTKKKWFGLLQSDELESLDIRDGLSLSETREFIELFLNGEYDLLKSYSS